jgi:hypothetical protein
MAHQPPIERFLGPIDPATGPFGVLGLGVRDATPEEIDAALARRLARLGSHAQGGSAEGDEVVLALHVAAAQLKDTTLRRALLAQIPRPDRPSPAGPVRSASARAAGAPMGFAELARATIAHSGGWNRKSRRRIASLAHTFGVSPDGLRIALAELATPTRAPDPAAIASDTRAEPERHPAPPPPRWLIASTAVLFLGAALLLALLIGIVVSRLPNDGGSGTLATEPGEAAAPAPVAQRVEPSDRLASAEGSSAPARDLPGALGALRRASGMLADRPAEARRTVAAAIAIIAAGWTEGDPDVVESAVAELSSLLTAAVRTDSAAAAGIADDIVALAMEADPVRPELVPVRVFGAGAVARLSRDTLTGAIESKFREAVVRLSDDAGGVRTRTFASGAALGLIRAARVCDGCASLEAAMPFWIRAHEGLTRIDAEAAEGALLDALGALLRSPPSREASAGIGAMAPRIAFDREGSRAAIRVIGWFDDRTIGVPALAGLTAALVSSGAVPGAPLDLLLSAAATEADRARVRDTLAARLGVPITAPAVRIADRLREQADAVLATAEPQDPVDALRLAARAAVVHHAAALKWIGRDGDAESVLALAADDAMGARLDAGSQQMGARLDLARLTGPASGSDGQWALRFAQAARNEDDRAKLLLELRSGSVAIGPADADVLAIAALGPNPPLLRKTAQRTMLMHAGNPFVIAAVTEAIPEAVATDDVADTLSAFTLTELPRHDDPEFRAAAARAASARLLTVLAPSIDRRIIALQELIAEAYAGVEAASPDPLDRPAESSRSLGADPTPADAAESIRAALRRSAQRYAEGRWTFVRLAELDRRHAARAALPQTDLERFVVEQLAIAETLAYLVAAERPTASVDAARILAEMEQAHLAARHPLHQVLAAERAIAALWVVRFGGAP